MGACLRALALLFASSPALACPLQPADGQKIDSGDIAVAWRTEPTPIPVGQHFRIVVVACTSVGAPFDGPIAVDASMPAHRHGMSYLPSVTPGGAGRFVVEGMLFHMPGHWEIVVRAGANPVRARLVTNVTVE